jgi:N-ethylmaleimide reductase
MSNTAALFKPLKLGALELPNRVLMAPLTRNRAYPDGRPREMAIEYYRQRALAGLLITEATQVSPLGKGYLNTPGIHNNDQAAAWQAIVDAVHQAGGRIFLQLWHVGRISHTSLLPDGQQPVAPSAIQADTQTFTEQGFEPVSKPRALSLEDIQNVLDEYRHAARLCQKVGFDGVEVHGANGYLINQFLATNTNQRTDAYGGSPEKRTRFLLEVVDAVSEVVGPERTGLRLSPAGQFNDIHDDEARQTYSYAINELNSRGLAYLHVVEQFPGFGQDETAHKLIEDLRGLWQGVYIANGGMTAESGARLIEQGKADAIAYGRPFIANPDLPRRFELGAPLNEPDQATFYGGNEHGYTDYPFLDA